MSVSTVTSEALQLKLRQLLPSQQGFGTDLSASDTIIPVIDLTAAAEGSDVPESLQTAIAFGSQTAFSVLSATTVLANSPGFWRIFGTATCEAGGGISSSSFTMTDGLSVKTIWSLQAATSTTLSQVSNDFDFVVFLAAGESISAVSNSIDANLHGSYRQVADVNGALIQPVGFSPQ